MGLDMYAWAVPKEVAGDTQVNLRLPKETKKRGLDYWRKFNNLHGWMERLYRKKGGQGDFNCDSVRLTEADLDQLLLDVKTLEPQTGFFFGPPEEMSADDIEDVTQFVANARVAIQNGEAVFYDSWW